MFITWLANYNFRVGELNDLLEDDQFLTDYPYQFKVISLNNGLAELSSPRSTEIPAVKFLAIINPDLKNSTTQDPKMIAAQKDLAKYQMYAKKLILEQSNVTKTQWVLDREWYAKRNIF